MPEDRTRRHVQRWRADPVGWEHASTRWIIEVGEIADGWYVELRPTGTIQFRCRVYDTRAQAMDVCQRLREHMSRTNPAREWTVWRS